MEFNPDDWISQADAAKMRGLSRQRLNQLVQDQRFRTLDVGGRPLVLRADVEAYEPAPVGRPSSEKAD